MVSLTFSRGPSLSNRSYIHELFGHMITKYSHVIGFLKPMAYTCPILYIIMIYIIRK